MQNSICVALLTILLVGLPAKATSFDFQAYKSDSRICALVQQANVGGEAQLVARRGLILTLLKTLATSKINARDQFTIEPGAAELILSQIQLSSSAFIGGRFLRQARGDKEVIAALDQQQGETWRAGKDFLTAKDREALIAIFPDLLNALVSSDKSLRGYLIYSQTISGLKHPACIVRENELTTSNVYAILFGVAVKFRLLRKNLNFQKKQIQRLVQAQAILEIASYLQQPIKFVRCKQDLI